MCLSVNVCICTGYHRIPLIMYIHLCLEIEIGSYFHLGLSRCEESESLFEALALGALSIQRFSTFCIFLPTKIIGGTVKTAASWHPGISACAAIAAQTFSPPTEFRPLAKARGVETCGKTRCDVMSSICHFLRLVRWTWVTIVNAPVTKGRSQGGHGWCI